MVQDNCRRCAKQHVSTVQEGVRWYVHIQFSRTFVTWNVRTVVKISGRLSVRPRTFAGKDRLEPFGEMYSIAQLLNEFSLTGHTFHCARMSQLLMPFMNFVLEKVLLSQVNFQLARTLHMSQYILYRLRRLVRGQNTPHPSLWRKQCLLLFHQA